MKTITAKEAKNRLGQAIDAALAEGVVMITKNGRDSVARVSAERYRQLIGIQSFIADENTAQKDELRREFAQSVKRGSAKSTDASMFHGLTAKSRGKDLNEEF